MAKCKTCNTDIPDGMEYCEKCIAEKNIESEESYLDNLLRTVINAQNNALGDDSDNNDKKESDISTQGSLSENMDKTTMDNNMTQGNTVIQDDDVTLDETINVARKEIEDDVIQDEGIDKVNSDSIIMEQIKQEKNEDVENREDLYNKRNDVDSDDDYFENTDDILALIQDFKDENNFQDETETSYQKESKEEDAYYNEAEDADGSLNDTDDDLLRLLDMISSQSEDNPQENKTVSSLNLADNLKQPDNSGEKEEISSTDEDILDVNALMQDDETSFNENILDQVEVPEVPKDVGKVFSDVVSAVDSLEDDENQDILNALPEFDQLVKEKEKKKEKKKDKKKKKDSFWKKLFSKNSANKSSGKKENKESKESENKKLDNSKNSAGGKKVKSTKKKDKNASTSSDDNSNENKGKSKGLTKNQKSKNKKVSKPKVKKVKNEKPIIVDQEEILENTKKISKVAAILVFAFFGTLALFIIFGTDIYSYSLDIKNANTDFARKRYTDAYQDICGLDLKKDDSKIYDKIMTVMYVNKQLNSYYNYYKIGKYPEALDSLLKGLVKYDKYIDTASKLGIKKDMNDIREKILSELDEKFNISEDEAKKLNSNTDQIKYSTNVFKAVSKR